MAPVRALGPDGPLLPVLNGVTLVWQFRPLGQQALTAPLAATLENAPTCLGGHASPEAVLALADTFGGLICTLAHGFQAVLGLRTLPGGRETICSSPFVNASGDFPASKHQKNLPRVHPLLAMDKFSRDSPIKAPSRGAGREIPIGGRSRPQAGNPGEHYASRSLLPEEATGLFQVLITTSREVCYDHIARR